MKIGILGAIAVVAVAGSAMAAPVTVFSDNFNGENGGTGALNYAGFANWTVANGTVDLIGNGYYDFYPGNGLYVDLDGSTQNAGSLTQTVAITFDAGTTYTLSFDLGGNHRGAPDDSVAIEIGAGSLFSVTETLSSADPLANYSYTFVGDGSTVSISFENGGGDNMGAILDNVLLTAVVPLPSAAGLAGLGLLVAGGLRRRNVG